MIGAKRREGTAPYVVPGRARLGTPFCLSLLGVIVLAFLLYWRTTGIGFLLDDFLLQGNIHEAFNGHPGALLHSILRGWNSADNGLVCYRPAIDISFALDYAIWKNNPFGYHLSQLIAYAANCVLTALVCFESAKLYSVRSARLAAISAAVLFCCYPLHVSTTAWIIGRVDGLCCLFYLSAILAYLRFLGSRAKITLALALGCTFIALACKEMAVTAPLVISLIELTRPSASGRKAWKAVAAFWLVLAAFAAVRTAALGTIVGGYGTTDKRLLQHALRNFFDCASWGKIVFPASDELAPPGWGQSASWLAVIVVAGAALFNIRRRNRSLLRLFTLLAAWMIIALIPTFQIFHIAPNLVGSRLFFISSAPMCMIISFALAGAVSGAGSASIAVGSIVGIAACWCCLTSINLGPWLEAGRRMDTATKFVQEVVAHSRKGQKVLFASLPADYKGAGLIGRPGYLLSMVKPPFLDEDLSDRVATCERPLPGPSDYVYPRQLQRIASLCQTKYFFDEREGLFRPLLLTDTTVNFFVDHVPAARNGVHWLDLKPFKPEVMQCFEVYYNAKQGHTAPAIDFVWRSPNVDWWRCLIPASIVTRDKLVFVPARLRAWTFAQTISNVGLQAGDDAVELESMRAVPLDTVQPDLHLQGSILSIDARKMPGCSRLRLLIMKAGEMVPDLPGNREPSAKQIEVSRDFSETSVSVDLQPFIPHDGKCHVVAALSLDNNNQPVGILSEPLAISN